MFRSVGATNIVPREWLSNMRMCSSFPDKSLKVTIVPVNEAHRFCYECMKAVGSTSESAKDLADVLIEADYRGHFSHGMSRLDVYVKEIKTNSSDRHAKPCIVTESPAVAVVDGNNGIGASTGKFCMQLAIKKAKQTGIGFVTARGCNHFGIAGWYTAMALDHDLIGISCTNTSPVMVPTRARKRLLGTNPISLAAPANDGDSFLLDMATSAVAFGKVEVARRKCIAIPEYWGADDNGQMTTDAHKVVGMYPLGGSEEQSSYKGTGLAMLVEVLTGILAGANFGPNIRYWQDFQDKANLGQCFIAINPLMFAPGFKDRMSELLKLIRTAESVCMMPVLVAGDPERIHKAKVDEDGGICYLSSQIEKCDGLAEELKVGKLRPKE